MNSMFHRLLSLVVVAVIGATPVARGLCYASCAEHPDHSGASAPATHADHVAGHATAANATVAHETAAHETAHSVPPPAHIQPAAAPCCTPAFSATHRTCVHRADWQVASPPVAKPVVDPPALLTAPVGFDVLTVAAPPAARDPLARTPIPLSLRTPLRV